LEDEVDYLFKRKENIKGQFSVFLHLKISYFGSREKLVSISMLPLFLMGKNFVSFGEIILKKVLDKF